MTLSCKKPGVILVDENDRELGVEEKLIAHQDGGLLHRAFSIFIFDANERMLLQQRAKSKYHCPGLWSNSCCSHPQKGISVMESAEIRLTQELGFTVPLTKIGTIEYRLGMANGLTEWELNHLWIGHYNGTVMPNSEEVEQFKWLSLAELETDLSTSPSAYTPWFPVILPELHRYFAELSARSAS